MTADAAGAARPVDVSDLEHTRLGSGHFITTAATYGLGDGTPVARCSHLLFRFTPGDGGSGADDSAGDHAG